jgi:hypothetical protein
MKSDRAGLWLLAGGAGLVLYGVAVRYLFPGMVPGVSAGGPGGIVLIFAGLVSLAVGAVLRLGD